MTCDDGNRPPVPRILSKALLKLKHECAHIEILLQKKNNFIKIKTAEPFDTREDPESQGWRSFLYRMQLLSWHG